MKYSDGTEMKHGDKVFIKKTTRGYRKSGFVLGEHSGTLVVVQIAYRHAVIVESAEVERFFRYQTRAESRRRSGYRTRYRVREEESENV
jgi:hypothetical protein